MVTAADRASTGATFLDQQRPGWENEIDPASLDIATGRWCVLGQLYGQYGNGLTALDIESPGRLGFAVSNEREELNAAWRDEIARRRLAAIPSAVPELVGIETY